MHYNMKAKLKTSQILANFKRNRIRNQIPGLRTLFSYIIRYATISHKTRSITYRRYALLSHCNNYITRFSLQVLRPVQRSATFSQFSCDSFAFYSAFALILQFCVVVESEREWRKCEEGSSARGAC